MGSTSIVAWNTQMVIKIPFERGTLSALPRIIRSVCLLNDCHLPAVGVPAPAGPEQASDRLAVLGASGTCPDFPYPYSPAARARTLISATNVTSVGVSTPTSRAISIGTV